MCVCVCMSVHTYENVGHLKVNGFCVSPVFVFSSNLCIIFLVLTTEFR